MTANGFNEQRGTVDFVYKVHQTKAHDRNQHCDELTQYLHIHKLNHHNEREGIQTSESPLHIALAG